MIIVAVKNVKYNFIICTAKVVNKFKKNHKK